MMTTSTVQGQIMEAFRFRHACKEFDPARPISDDEFGIILEAGRLSPSSYGFEPWKFLVIQNPALREKLRTVTWGAQKTLPTASHFVAILSRTAEDLHPDADYITYIMEQIQQLPPEVVEGKRKMFRTFQDRDFSLTGNDRALQDWAAKQAYIALANMMTAAALLGIDSCPVEGFEWDKVNAVLREEGLLADGAFEAVVMAGFGYRVREPRAKTRRNADEVIQWVR